eukprot:GILJ01022728.1.p1 GENE.GILJ01022728.1~~GILJ01022728.1.p1  ORF type:complete len:313 (-),score=46.67 GILJ01022728.1:256-1194(-)
MVRLEEELERTSKYLKRWVKRFVSFDDGFKRMSYGTSKYRIKRTMRVTGVTRVTDVSHSIPPNTGEPYEVIVDGILEGGENCSWSLRMPDINSFNLWYITLRNSLLEMGAFSTARFTASAGPPPPLSTIPDAAVAASTSSPLLDPFYLEYRARLVRFYEKYSPDKLRHVDTSLAKYKGKEKAMFVTLVAKYGPEPPYIDGHGSSKEATSKNPMPLVRSSHSVNNSFGAAEDFEVDDGAAASGGNLPPKAPDALVAKSATSGAADRQSVAAAVEVPADSIRASYTATIEAQQSEINIASDVESLDISIDSDDI